MADEAQPVLLGIAHHGIGIREIVDSLAGGDLAALEAVLGHNGVEMSVDQRIGLRVAAGRNAGVEGHAHLKVRAEGVFQPRLLGLSGQAGPESRQEHEFILHWKQNV